MQLQDHKMDWIRADQGIASKVGDGPMRALIEQLRLLIFSRPGYSLFFTLNFFYKASVYNTRTDCISTDMLHASPTLAAIELLDKPRPKEVTLESLVILSNRLYSNYEELLNFSSIPKRSVKNITLLNEERRIL